jgi:hypothetical protein
MDVLHLPAMVYKLHGQPIDERLVSRRWRAEAEVEHILNERLSKVALPDMIDGHSSSKRVSAINQPFGKR